MADEETSAEDVIAEGEEAPRKKKLSGKVLVLFILLPLLVLGVGGGKPDATAYVELLLRSSGKSIVTWKKASGEDTMAEQSYDVSQHVGQVARIRIVDHSETGHVKADSFHFRN